MRLVSQNGDILRCLAPQLRSKRAIVWAAVKSHPQALAHAPLHFKNDVDIVSRALRNGEGETCADVFQHIGPELSNDPVIFRQLATLAVTCNYHCAKYFAGELKQDQLFLKELFLLAYKADLSRNDDWVVDKDVLQDHQLYRQMAIDFLKRSRTAAKLKRFPDFCNDREVAEAAIKRDPFNLKYASLRLREDRALVKLALAENGATLYYASDTLRDDSELVFIAVKSNGEALEYASERLRGSPDIVTAALQSEGSALESASEPIRSDPHFARLAVSRQKPTASIRSYLPPSFYGDKALMMMALERNYTNFRYISDALRDDDELVSMVLKYHGDQLEYASARLRDDRDVVCLAVASKGRALRHASQRLRADRDVVELALRNDGMALQHAHQQLQACLEIVAIAVQQNGLALQFAPASCSDKYLVTLALHNNGEALRFVDLSLWDDPDIIAVAVGSIGPVAVEGIRLDILPGLLAFKQPHLG